MLRSVSVLSADSSKLRTSDAALDLTFGIHSGLRRRGRRPLELPVSSGGVNARRKNARIVKPMAMGCSSQIV